MTSRPVRPGERDQLLALKGSFLTRFFDNDITGGSNDLRTSFFWLVGFLAAPGFLIAVMMMWQWETIGRFRGAAALRDSAMSSKLLYLSFAMTASALLAAITWNSLLLDRRDALILGGLPVRARTVVGGKLIALAAYLGLLALAMHGLSSISFGIVLASGSNFAFLLRGIAAHLLAGGIASAFLFLAITSAQGVALALTGPRAFKRVSSVLQVALIAGVLIALTLQPLFAMSTRDTLAGFGDQNRPWMLWTPPFWFLGTYEWLLGTDSSTLTGLHQRGMAALAILVVVTAASYLVSYARLSRAAVEGGDAVLPARKAAAASEWLVRSLTRQAPSRAAAQFFLTSLTRVERLRFVTAIAVGIVVGWSGPVIYFWAVANAQFSSPPSTLLALSFADIAFLAAGLRIAAAMPADLNASWIVAAVDAPGVLLRSGAWRVIFAIGVVPVVALFLPVLAWFWGGLIAVEHSMILLASGALLVELLLWNDEEMPSASPWRPEHAELGKRWPLYVIAFALFSTGIAAIEGFLLPRPILLGMFIVLLLGLTFLVRLAHRRRRLIPRDDFEDLGAPAVLKLG